VAENLRFFDRREQPQPFEILGLGFKHPVVWYPPKRRRAAERRGGAERLRPW